MTDSGIDTQPYSYDFSSDDDAYLAEIDGPDTSKKSKFETQKHAVIYLLDSRIEMFSKDDLLEDKVPFVQCLQCIRNAMRAKIWSSEYALCGLLLLGTKKSDNILSLNNICMINPLKDLSADHILKVDEIIKMVEDGSFGKEYGSDAFSLADAFWLCSRIFNDNTKNRKLNKTILLFTNDDNPTKDNRTEFDRIISSARDMVENNIMFDLIHLGENFNVNYLFKELIQVSRGDMDYVIPDSVSRMKDMVKRTTKIDYRHVTLSKVPFHITSNFKCEVTVHYLVRKAKPPFKVKLSKATNELVTTKTQFFETETGEVISKSNLVKSYKLGGKEIGFTMSELKHIDSFSEKGLRLLGFKPAATVNLEHYVKPCAFIYPAEPEDTSASAFFVALLTRCLKRQMVPICIFCPRSRSALRYAALIAKEEEIAPDKTQICPSGFLVFFLPYAEEVRDLDEKCTGKNRASAEEVDLAKKLIKKLKFNYKPEMFPNPKLASHWSAVEALALNLKVPEPFSDSTLPNVEVMKERTEAIASELRDRIYTDEYDPEGKLPRKRTQAATTSKSPGKKLEVDTSYVKEIITSGNAHKLTSEVLKMYLQQVGEGKGLSKMKKSDLIEKACQFLNVPLP